MNIINSYIQFPASGGGTSGLIQLELCTGGATVYVTDTTGVSPSVNNVISYDRTSDSAVVCAKVVALNQTNTPTGNARNEYGSYASGGCDICVIYEGGGEGEFCLLPHMLVKLQSGILTKVIDLNVGDYIEGPDGYTEVIEVIKDHPRSGYHIINNELHISDDHPIKYQDLILRADEYPGDNAYIEEETNTVYVGTESSFYHVYCNDNVYTVSGQYRS